MRLLFIYQFLTLGGVESVIRNRYIGLKSLGYDVEVESLFLSQLVKGQVDLGDRVHITSDPGEIQRIAGRADVISIIDTPQVFDALASLRRPVIVEVHTPYDQSRAYVHQPFPRSTRMVLTPSHAFQRLLEREVPHRTWTVEALHNPLDLAFFAPASAAPCPHLALHGARPILWVGRLDDLKDWQRAGRIASRIFKELDAPDLELFMLGRHVSPTIPVDVFRREGILGRVRHMTSASFASMPTIYRTVAEARGIYLSTSKGESFGMTVAESMASSLPCLVHRLPVLEEVSAGKAAYYRTDAEAVEEACSLLTDTRRYDASALELRQVARRYRPEETTKALYEKLLRVASA